MQGFFPSQAVRGYQCGLSVTGKQTRKRPRIRPSSLSSAFSGAYPANSPATGPTTRFSFLVWPTRLLRMHTGCLAGTAQGSEVGRQGQCEGIGTPDNFYCMRACAMILLVRSMTALVMGNQGRARVGKSHAHGCPEAGEHDSIICLSYNDTECGRDPAQCQGWESGCVKTA